MNLKWLKDLNIRPENIKLPEENIGHSDINCNNIFLDLFWKAKETKTKMNKWDKLNLKPLAQQEKPSTKWEDNLLNERKYLQMIWPVRG